MVVLHSAAMAALVANVAAVGGGSAGGSDWRYFAAGGIGAAVSHGYTTPIDVVKTRMQTNPELYDGSVMKCVGRICREEGPQFLLQGLGPTAVGYGVEGALKFGFYELFKPIFAQISDNDFLNYLLASIVAGAVASVVLCPAEDVRIRLVADPSFAPDSVSALKKLVKTEGPFASFRGLNAMLAKQVPYTMTKQVSFDFVTSMIKAAAPPAIAENFPTLLTTLSSAITAVLACIASHPGDMVLSATFKQSDSDKPRTTLEILTEITKEHGLGGLFLGINARFGHIIAIITPQLVIYDTTKQLLGLPATGSH